MVWMEGIMIYEIFKDNILNFSILQKKKKKGILFEEKHKKVSN